MPARLAALALCSLVCGGCCNDRGAARRGTDSPRPDDARPEEAAKDASGPCAPLRPRVEEIYRREQGPPPEQEEKRELRAEILRANVHMILKDCRRDPERFVPCIEEAESVDELESDCIIPLDDEGKVEGRRFGD